MAPWRPPQPAPPGVERLAGDALDHGKSLAREIAGRKAGGHVRTRQPRQDHLLQLETVNGRMVLSLAQKRYLHQQWRCEIGANHAPQRRLAAAMDALADRKTV